MDDAAESFCGAVVGIQRYKYFFYWTAHNRFAYSGRAKRHKGTEGDRLFRRREESRTIVEVRRGFIKVAVLEQGYQASEAASFLGCQVSPA